MKITSLNRTKPVLFFLIFLITPFLLVAQNGKIKETIEMSKKLAAGTYYLGLYQDNKAVVKQFIKE